MYTYVYGPVYIGWQTNKFIDIKKIIHNYLRKALQFLLIYSFF